ncbi:hypothetical protein ACJX0J_039508, partial [Zea mays]
FGGVMFFELIDGLIEVVRSSDYFLRSNTPPQTSNHHFIILVVVTMVSYYIHAIANLLDYFYIKLNIKLNYIKYKVPKFLTWLGIGGRMNHAYPTLLKITKTF